MYLFAKLWDIGLPVVRGIGASLLMSPQSWRLMKLFGLG